MKKQSESRISKFSESSKLNKEETKKVKGGSAAIVTDELIDK